MNPLADSGLNTADLQHAHCFPHKVNKIEIIETHISWVVLTGPFAYKIKKPVQLPFVDYSTPQKRLYFCESELELNMVYAPTIYLEVVAISLIGNEIRFEDDRNVIEYAVKMRQFEQSAILVHQLEFLEQRKEMVDGFADRLAHFHVGAQPSTANPTGSRLGRFSKVGETSVQKVEANDWLGSAEQVYGEVLENVQFLAEEFRNSEYSDHVGQILTWTELECQRLRKHLDTRREMGFVRLCHGDMHLKNLLWHQGKIVPFDCIEFNEKFQWIDVASDLSFPVMDLAARGKSNLAWRLLSQYLESSDDYDALNTLGFYLVYRALIRAKVGWLNPKNHVKGRERKPWGKYIDWAWGMINREPKYLAITHGFSGSGKSTRALRLVENDGAIRIRSDVVRDRCATKQGPGRYSPEAKQMVYDRMLEIAKRVLDAGWPVVVDATFLKRSNREMFFRLANSQNISFQIVDCEAPIPDLKRRIAARTNDPSEADAAVIDYQVANSDPLTYSESMFCK